MGFGVLEDRVLSHVPGTERLEDKNCIHSPRYSSLKKTKDGIILVPQPSDDPLDPLNFPLWRRDMITAILSLAAVFAATLTPLMAANNLTYLFWFSGISITEIAMLTGWHILGTGIGGYFFVASARIWGKRHLYLLGMLIVVASSVWGGCSGHNYKSLVAARFFQGVGLSPFEALLNASVGELYFVHESGLRMALSNMCLFGAAFLSPVVVGHMTATLGWQWTFWMVAVLEGATFPLVLLLCPETAYARHNKTVKEPSTPDSIARYDSTGGSLEKVDIETSASFSSDVDQTTPRDNIYQLSHTALISRQSLRIFTGRKTDEGFLKVFARPAPLFFHPAVFWACLVAGSIIAWTTILGVMLAVLFVGFGFDEVETGNMWSGAFIGAFIGFIGCAVLSDNVAKYMTRWNKGIWLSIDEPEFRLILIIPLLLFGAGGLYGFGITAANPIYGYYLPDVFLAFVCGALVFGTVAPSLYIVDAYREYTVDAFTLMLFFKSLLSWLLCYKGYFWLEKTGARKLFVIIASVQVGICALTIPLYVFGKKLRSFFARYDYLKWMRLDKPTRG